MLLGDFHTHSTLDDGKSTLEEMAAAAYDFGVTHFGFSGHSFEEYGQDFCLPKKDVPIYLETARKLQEAYRGRMEVFVGMELDYFGENPGGLDYVIGSVHCVKQGDAACYVDESAQASQRAVDEYFGGDWYRYTDAYYDLVAERPGASGSATLTWSPNSMNRPIPSMRTVPGICAGHWKRWSTWSNRVWPLRSTPGLWPVATAPHLTPAMPCCAS